MKLFSRLLILSAFICFNHISQAQSMLECHVPDPAGHWAEPIVDFQKLDLDIKIMPKDGKVEGTAVYTLNTRRSKTDSIILNAIDIKFIEVYADNQIVKYNAFDKQHIVIYIADRNWKANQAHSLKIQYSASPKKGMYFIGFNDSSSRSRKQIWTQGQGIDNRNWVPGWDDPTDKLITNITVSINEKWNLLCNGVSLGKVKTQKIKGENYQVFSYKMSHPHSFYLMMIGAGDYKVQAQKSKSGVPMYNWYYTDQPERLEPSYRYTTRIMDILERETGVKYPWESYSQIPVQDFLYGAMENTTATVFGDFFYIDNRTFLDRNYVGVNAHEMTHQWFGDLISAKSYQDQWLQESFATYYAKVCEHDIWGETFYLWNKRGEQNAAIAAEANNHLPVANTGSGSARIYQKGSMVIDMLRYVLGKDDYDRVIKHYLTKYAYGNVTTFDFYNSFHDVLGVNLDWFFDQWIHRGGIPNYDVSYRTITENNQSFVEIRVEQIQANNEVLGLFKMPVWIEVATNSNKIMRQYWVNNKFEIIKIPISNDETVKYCVFDPNNDILRQVTYHRNQKELFEVLQSSSYPLAKYDALLELKNTPIAQKSQKLIENYDGIGEHFIKSEILVQLGDSAAHVKTIIKGLSDKESKVRLSAVNAVSQYNVEIITKLKTMLIDSSYLVVEASLNKLCSLDAVHRLEYLDVVKDVFGIAGNVKFAYLKWSSQFAGTIAMQKLSDYAAPAFEFRTRINAFNALQEINYMDNATVLYLMQAVNSSNGRLARPASDALTFFAKQRDKKDMLQQVLNSNTYWSKDEKATIQKFIY
ncbi:MAG: M1 family metallopeptidase [Bacteroidota bacterium]|nr:M1 family metallopeptidase [Bacteroidota bacterium]